MDLLNADALAAAVEALVQLVERRCIDDSVGHYAGPLGFYRDFRTVKVDVGRRTGKTTLIQHALTRTPADVVVVGTRSIADMLYRDVVPPSRVLIANSGEELSRQVARLGHVRRVYVDEPSLVNMPAVYQALGSRNPTCFILLGS